MLGVLAAALAPSVVTVLLGWVAARRHDFAAADAAVLNRMVLTYALPLGIFVDVVRTPRAAFAADAALVGTVAGVMVGFYVAVFLLCRFGLRAGLGLSALAALAASGPNVPFVGSGVLSALYGTAAAIPVAVGSLLLNVTVVPATVILLGLGSARAGGGTSAGSGAARAALARAVRQPLVWLPLLGLLVVLGGVRVPGLADASVALLGTAATGVALFTTGVVAAGYRVRLTRPVLALVAAKLALQPLLAGLAIRLWDPGTPLFGETVVTMALPMLTVVAMLSVEHGVEEPTMTSALIASLAGSLLTLAVAIALTGA